MKSYKIFIVEDDPWYGEILEYHLSLNPDYEIFRFKNGKECLSNLQKKPVIFISAQEDVSTAVELLKSGVSDYIVKDDNTKNVLWNTVIKIRENQSLKKEVEELREELGKKYEFGK